MPPGRKNKRGARGSVEEEISAAKRSNMASSEAGASNEENLSQPSEQAEQEEQEEPSLHEIKSMLVDIQITVSSIALENKQLKKELADLKTSIQTKDKELSKLKISVDKTAKSNDALEKKLQATATSLEATRRELDKQSQEVDRLNEALDNLEQYTRKNSLEFHGIPENSYQSTEEVVLKLAAALEVQVTPSDIEISHKLKRKSGANVIIAKFCSHKIKTKLYKQRTKLKNIKASDLFPGYAAAAARFNDRLFINENLTSYRRGLVDSANRIRRDGCIHSLWTMDGKLFVKTSPEGNPVRIFSENDLEYL